MKITIKFLGTAIIMASIIMINACKGPAGDVGPAGAAGANGTNGTNGTNGNANVIQISYGSKTHTGSDLSYSLTGVSQTQMNSSLFLTYVKPGGSTNWYQIPGYTSGGTFQYRIYLTDSSTPLLYVSRITGTGTDIFTATRILVIPANDIRNGRNVGVDYSNYEEVKAYYGLKD